MGEALVYDIEADGFLDNVSRIHCIVTQGLNSGEINQYYGSKEEIRKGVKELYFSSCIIAHNQIGYDLPVLKKFYPGFTQPNIVDTYICSCLLAPERKHHSIESYASSSEYDKVPITDWSCLTYSILDRCTLDVILNRELYIDMYNKELHTGDWDDAVELEQEVYSIHHDQVEAGFLVNREYAEELVSDFDHKLAHLSESIKRGIPKQVSKGATIKKVFKKDGSYMKYVQSFIDNIGGRPTKV